MRIVLMVLVMLASAVELALLGRDVSIQIDRQSGAGSDNVQWALSQVDVELLYLEGMIDEARRGTGKLAELRQRFDVIYSRVRTLETGSVFAPLRANPDFAASFARLERFMTATAGLLDGPDAALQASLPVLEGRIREVLPDSHRIALVGVTVFAAEADAQRAGVKRALVKMAVLTVVLVAALLVALIRVLHLDRGNRIRVAENAATLARLDAVVATSLDPVITLDEAGRIVDFNPAASQTFGLERRRAVGQGLSLLVPPSAAGEPQLPPLTEPLVSGRRRMRVTARHRDGHEFPAEVSLSSAQAGSRPVHVVFLRDLSQQAEAEQALVTARDEALAGEKAKAELLVVMSHEIRTPLNGMIGTIELLEATALAPHQREYLRIMAASGRLLMHHVNDVLDIARLDSGKATLNLGPVDLAALIGEVLENQRPAALNHGNRLTFVHAPDGRNLVQADAALLRQVLMNLVGNAVKFTRDGEISVAISHLTARGPTEIVVRDTGVGIAREDLGRIFEDFVTLDPSYARSTSGTGLGLGIVRRIVTRMGGQISVDSETGVGSTFRVTLPMTIMERIGKDLTASAPQAATRASLSVLVIEDNDFNRLIVHDMLVQDGHRVVTAPDGLQGVRLAADQVFDVVLMDISMPGIDGLQAAARIRQGKGASCGARIIALTAHALPSEAASFRAGGLQSVLVKPVTRDSLRSALNGQDATLRAVPDTLVDLDVLLELEESIGAARAYGLITRFLSDTEARINGLVEAAGPSAGTTEEAAGAAADLTAEVHRMSGTAAMFGAAALHAHLIRIEDLCKLGDRPAAAAEVPGLAALWQRTSAAYRDRAYRTGGVLVQASSLR
ncbi:MAG: hypothetical protein B7Y02_04975 [Rhodobacterales bacterium 17-64-5]|nr:MAG: hypothetical protein B7Y02_04975 [Rhodobacterales bacterium 17-64-5]